MIFVLDRDRAGPRGLASLAIDDRLQDQSVAFVNTSRPHDPAADKVRPGARQLGLFVDDPAQQILTAHVINGLK